MKIWNTFIVLEIRCDDARRLTRKVMTPKWDAFEDDERATYRNTLPRKHSQRNKAQIHQNKDACTRNLINLWIFRARSFSHSFFCRFLDARREREYCRWMRENQCVVSEANFSSIRNTTTRLWASSSYYSSGSFFLEYFEIILLSASFEAVTDVVVFVVVVFLCRRLFSRLVAAVSFSFFLLLLLLLLLFVSGTLLFLYFMLNFILSCVFHVLFISFCVPVNVLNRVLDAGAWFVAFIEGSILL